MASWETGQAHHNGEAQAYDLFIQPSNVYGVIEYLMFSNAWAAGVTPNDTPVYVANPYGANCTNIKFKRAHGAFRSFFW